MPTKYLVKVGGEEKEPRFEVGDNVRFGEVGELMRRGIVRDVLPNGFYAVLSGGKEWYVTEDALNPYTEPTEDEIIRQREAEFDEFRKAELDKVLHPEKYVTYEATVDNVAMNWDAYTADLAKEIAVKITNKHMDNNPKEVGRYAVQTAKAVVEELKKKQ